MLQALLADRFKLAVHRETRDIPIYALLAAKSGMKLPAAREGSCVEFGPGGEPPGHSPLAPCGAFVAGPNLLAGGRISMSQFADVVSNLLDRRVIDKTGFSGTFNVRLEFAPEGIAGLPADADKSDSSRPSIFTALQEQLGLKLKSQKAPADVLVIDHAERAPTEN